MEVGPAPDENMWQLLLLAFLLYTIVLAVMGSIIGFVFGVIVKLLMRIDGKKSKGTKKKELSDTEKASQDDVKQPSSTVNKGTNVLLVPRNSRRIRTAITT